MPFATDIPLNRSNSISIPNSLAVGTFGDAGFLLPLEIAKNLIFPAFTCFKGTKNISTAASVSPLNIIFLRSGAFTGSIIGLQFANLVIATPAIWVALPNPAKATFRVFGFALHSSIKSLKVFHLDLALTTKGTGCWATCPM